jgi:hypothetical protein
VEWPVDVTYLGATGAVIAAKVVAVDGDTILYVEESEKSDDTRSRRTFSFELRVPRGREPDGFEPDTTDAERSPAKDIALFQAACADRSGTPRGSPVCPGMILSVVPRATAPRLALCLEKQGQDYGRTLYRRQASTTEWTEVNLGAEIRGIEGAGPERAYAWSNDTVYWTSTNGRRWKRIASAPSGLEFGRDGGTDSQGRLTLPLSHQRDGSEIESVLVVDGARRVTNRFVVGVESHRFGVVDGGFVAAISDEEEYVDELTRFECSVGRCQATDSLRLAGSAVGIASDGDQVLVAEVVTDDDHEALTYFVLPSTVLLSRDGGRSWIQGPPKQDIREIVPVAPGTFVVLRDFLRIESWRVQPPPEAE